MPTATISKVASTCQLDVDFVEKIWQEAQTAAGKKHKKGDTSFYPVAMSVFKKKIAGSHPACLKTLGWKNEENPVTITAAALQQQLENTFYKDVADLKSKKPSRTYDRFYNTFLMFFLLYKKDKGEAVKYLRTSGLNTSNFDDDHNDLMALMYHVVHHDTVSKQKIRGADNEKLKLGKMLVILRDKKPDLDEDIPRQLLAKIWPYRKITTRLKKPVQRFINGETLDLVAQEIFDFYFTNYRDSDMSPFVRRAYGSDKPSKKITDFAQLDVVQAKWKAAQAAKKAGVATPTTKNTATAQAVPSVAAAAAPKAPVTTVGAIVTKKSVAKAPQAVGAVLTKRQKDQKYLEDWLKKSPEDKIAQLQKEIYPIKANDKVHESAKKVANYIITKKLEPPVLEIWTATSLTPNRMENLLKTIKAKSTAARQLQAFADWMASNHTALIEMGDDFERTISVMITDNQFGNFFNLNTPEGWRLVRPNDRARFYGSGYGVYPTNDRDLFLKVAVATPRSSVSSPFGQQTLFNSVTRVAMNFPDSIPLLLKQPYTTPYLQLNFGADPALAVRELMEPVSYDDQRVVSALTNFARIAATNGHGCEFLKCQLLLPFLAALNSCDDTARVKEIREKHLYAVIEESIKQSLTANLSSTIRDLLEAVAPHLPADKSAKLFASITAKVDDVKTPLRPALTSNEGNKLLATRLRGDDIDLALRTFGGVIEEDQLKIFARLMEHMSDEQVNITLNLIWGYKSNYYSSSTELVLRKYFVRHKKNLEKMAKAISPQLIRAIIKYAVVTRPSWDSPGLTDPIYRPALVPYKYLWFHVIFTRDTWIQSLMDQLIAAGKGCQIYHLDNFATARGAPNLESLNQSAWNKLIDLGCDKAIADAVKYKKAPKDLMKKYVIGTKDTTHGRVWHSDANLWMTSYLESLPDSEVLALLEESKTANNGKFNGCKMETFARKWLKNSSPVVADKVYDMLMAEGAIDAILRRPYKVMLEMMSPHRMKDVFLEHIDSIQGRFLSDDDWNDLLGKMTQADLEHVQNTLNAKVDAARAGDAKARAVKKYRDTHQAILVRMSQDKIVEWLNSENASISSISHHNPQTFKQYYDDSKFTKIVEKLDVDHFKTYYKGLQEEGNPAIDNVGYMYLSNLGMEEMKKDVTSFSKTFKSMQPGDRERVVEKLQQNFIGQQIDVHNSAFFERSNIRNLDSDTVKKAANANKYSFSFPKGKSKTDPDALDTLLQINADMKPLALARVEMEKEPLRAETERLAINLTAQSAHGDLAFTILRKFTVANQPSGSYEQFAKKYNQQTAPLYHGTGYLAASFILRSGFLVVKGSLIKAGRAMGNGIYFAPFLDKSLQYVGDSGFSRRYGSTGFIFECEVALGHRLTHHRWDTDAGHKFRSKEVAVFQPTNQIYIKNVFEIELTSRKRLEQAIGKPLATLHERRSSPRRESFEAYFIFQDGRIPVNGQMLDMQTFSRRFPSITVDAAQGQGIGVWLKANRQYGTFEIENTQEWVRSKGRGHGTWKRLLKTGNRTESDNTSSAQKVLSNISDILDESQK